MHIIFDKTTYVALGTRYKLQGAQFYNLIIDNHDDMCHIKILGIAYL